jgi:hypothetical protein
LSTAAASQLPLHRPHQSRNSAWLYYSQALRSPPETAPREWCGTRNPRGKGNFSGQSSSLFQSNDSKLLRVPYVVAPFLRLPPQILPTCRVHKPRAEPTCAILDRYSHHSLCPTWRPTPQCNTMHHKLSWQQVGIYPRRSKQDTIIAG